MSKLCDLKLESGCDLNNLAKKYRTDKVDEHHSYKGVTYLDIYQRYMSNKRNDVKTFVEIGVRDGASLRMWKEYFPNATIYGIDIDARCEQHNEDNIEIIIGDQNDDTFLNNIKNKFKSTGIDILLDDGSHITTHQIKTFDCLYPVVNKNGLFIIEDLANSYEEWGNNDINLRYAWPGMIYNKPSEDLKNFRFNFNEFINDKVKCLDLNKKHSGLINPMLVSIHHYPMIVIFENI